MQHIAHGYAQHYCSNAQCKEREPALDEIHHSKSEQGAEDYGQDEQGQGIPIAEADEDKYEHDDECTKQCGGQIVFDGRGVIVTAGGSTMITDADIGVRLSETFNFVVEHLEQSVALSGIGGRKSWSDKGNANSTVGHEEMSVNSFEATLRSGEKWLHPLSQQVAHAHGIHLYEFGIGRAKLAFHVFAVFRHLLLEVFDGEQRVHVCIDRRVDVSREMGSHVVDGIVHDVFGYLVEDVADDSLILWLVTVGGFQ